MDVVAEAEQLAVRGEGGREIGDAGGRRRRGRQVLEPVLRPANRSAEHLRDDAEEHDVGEDRAATVDPVRQASGWRYITLQIADIDAVHDELRSKGVREGLAPITLGDVARISMILDPDGNWIELSRRASIVGGLS